MNFASECRSGLPARPETSPYVCMSTGVQAQLHALMLLRLADALLFNPAALWSAGERSWPPVSFNASAVLVCFHHACSWPRSSCSSTTTSRASLSASRPSQMQRGQAMWHGQHSCWGCRQLPWWRRKSTCLHLTATGQRWQGGC